MKITQITSVPGSISDQNLEEKVCKALSLTGVEVEDLHTCH